MTTGIYILKFKNTDKVYVGQSKDIEQRWDSHRTSLRRGLSPYKLQEAYNEFGMPSLEILIDDCTIEELDTLEEEAFSIFDSINNGFNTMSNSGHSSTLYGDSCGNSKYPNELIEEIFHALVDFPELTHLQIEEVFGVSRSLISDISRLDTHRWLKIKYPDKYNKLELLLANRRKTRRTAQSRGIIYPSIKSPDGNIYSVDSIRGFAREHNLNCHALGRVLRGQAQSHAGWVLA